MSHLTPALQLRFPTYTFRPIRADDIRIKLGADGRESIRGLLDENGSFRLELPRFQSRPLVGGCYGPTQPHVRPPASSISPLHDDIVR